MSINNKWRNICLFVFALSQIVFKYLVGGRNITFFQNKNKQEDNWPLNPNAQIVKNI